MSGPWDVVRDDSLGFLGPKDEPAVADQPSGLDDLFDEGDTDAPATKPAPVATPTPAAVRVEVARSAAEEKPASEAPVFGATGTPASSPTNAPGLVVGVGAGQGLVATGSSLAERIEEQRREVEEQLRAREHLYDVVDRILAFVSQDPELQKMVAEFELTRDLEQDYRQRVMLEERTAPKLLDASIFITNPREVGTVFDMAYDELIGISVVGDLWRDPDVDEIMIDAWDRICVERYGRLEDTGRRFRSQEHAERVARNLSQIISDRMVSRTNALPTAELPKARIQFVWGNIAASGMAITIRKFRDLLGMDALLSGASLSEEMRDFLVAAVHARATILVSGGTGTGKTTMINALSEFIPDSERVITIEDAFELQLSNRHVVSLQAKAKSSSDDTVVYTQEDLMIASLRMRPDRIIVGEIREASAAVVMLQAANTGHEGTMTTLHAENAAGALNNRMTNMLMRAGVGFSDEVARSEVAQAFDLVIQISKRAGHRFISEINLVDVSFVETGYIRSLPLFSGAITVGSDPEFHDVQRVTAYFRQVGRVPRTSKLGMKLAEAGEDAQRWLV